MYRKKYFSFKQSKRQVDYQKSEIFVEDVVVLDFETTGFDPMRNDIIQIGAIKFEKAKMIDQFARYARASHPIPQRITEITGITDEDVEDAPPIKESLIQLRDFISDYTLVAHNASFDLKFLIENFRRFDISYPPLKVIDSLTIARKYIHETRNHKLTTIKNFLRMEAQSHDAIEDCRVTGQLYYYCKIRKEKQPGNYQKKYHSEYKEEIRQLKREGKNQKAIDLLSALIPVVEKEAEVKIQHPSPWYYEQLAILYRKEQENSKELSILKRYFQSFKKYRISKDKQSKKLVERYQKLI